MGNFIFCVVSQSEAKVKKIYRQVERFKNNHKGSKVENIVIHVGTNNIQRECPRDSSRKIHKLLQKVKSDFQNTEVYFSGILPKLESITIFVERNSQRKQKATCKKKKQKYERRLLQSLGNLCTYNNEKFLSLLKQRIIEPIR